jgi:hypothetical protein
VKQILLKQIANITEAGLKTKRHNLQKKFRFLKKNRTDETLKAKFVKTFSRLWNWIWMRWRKKWYCKTRQRPLILDLVTGTLCFLITFNLLVNLPNNIANPIKELWDSIKQMPIKTILQVHFYEPQWIWRFSQIIQYHGRENCRNTIIVIV